jgi:hypothetical protein
MTAYSIVKTVIIDSQQHSHMWTCRCKKYNPFYFVLPVIKRNEISGNRRDFKLLSIKYFFDFSTYMGQIKIIFQRVSQGEIVIARFIVKRTTSCLIA